MNEINLRAVELDELVSLELKPRELILNPWLPTQGLAMIHARRGVGKTHLSVGIAYAVASGSPFLNWSAPVPRGVLFIDGEMPANLLRDRFQAAREAAGQPLLAPLRILTPDLQERGIPDLATPAGQRALERHLSDDIALIILDNLSTLVRSGVENDAESWEPVQTWALQQRAKGRSVLFIHHSNKNGGQRGTSRREDVLDSVISLRQSEDHTPEDGASFEVHFEKARFFYGADAASFGARLTSTAEGKPQWSTATMVNDTTAEVARLNSLGLNQTQIAQELGVNKSTVSRQLRRAHERGVTSRCQGHLPV
jgi:RecA-family ATPase/DNA-binding CsgD family transcriptional regulator